MIKKLILYLFPYRFKVGDIVDCKDSRCQQKLCQVDRVYFRGADKIRFLRLKITGESGFFTINTRADQCLLIKKA